FDMPDDGEAVGEPRAISVAGKGISRVTFAMDGEVLSDLEDAPYSWTLDPSTWSGRHVLAVTAYRDREADSREATLRFPGDRRVAFAAPRDGSVVAAPTDLRAEGDGITAVRFRLDGVVRHEDAEAPFAWRLDPGAVFEGDHTLQVEAILAAGRRVHGCVFRTERPRGERPSPEAILAAIRALKPGQWYEIPGTWLSEVAPSPGTYPNVIRPWSGGAYDTKRDRLVVFGGGHGDYDGNEIYAFDMRDFRWRRLTDPSAFPPGDEKNLSEKRTHPDGAPVSRHTYEYLEYVPSVDRFFVGGGAGLWFSGQFSDPMTYMFDFDALRWTQHGECPCYGVATSAIGPDGRVWMHGSHGKEAVLAAFDATASEWTRYAPFRGWLGYGRTAEIDPVERKYVMIGAGEVRIWDLDHPDGQHVVAETTGATAAERLDYPGAAYHPGTKRIVVWGGGANVYALDVARLQWTARETSGVDTTPPSATRAGTLGRWRHVPSLDVFVVVNDVRGNVFVYRH
ncbi:MAG: Ig-like domain-containing protein, partial [Planctomycetes bacterium]|nr:Ig-like domain-containing protein [Planctomycetota bacterium]